MKTKVTFEKLNCDFWNLSELKEPFENGELYHKASGQFYRIKNRSDLSLCAVVGSGVYKLVETKVTLNDELSKISFEGVKACCFAGLIALCDEDFEMHVSEDFILKIAEAIKRHKGQ